VEEISGVVEVACIVACVAVVEFVVEVVIAVLGTSGSVREVLKFIDGWTAGNGLLEGNVELSCRRTLATGGDETWSCMMEEVSPAVPLMW